MASPVPFPFLPDRESLPENPGAPRWQRELAEAFRAVEPLLRHLGLRPEEAPFPLDLQPSFPFLVTRPFADRMRKGDWRDPLLLQVLPREEEKKITLHFSQDAVGDAAARKAPGLLHKYGSRALLMATGQCAVHCRYCFRRSYPYGSGPRREADFEQAFRYLEAHPEIDEAIFSGGDPLSLADSRLFPLLARAAALPRIRTLRLHTRFPLLLPSRIDARFAAALAALPKKTLLVVHVNHARELDAACREALARLRQAGALLLNQTVLLRGVNDSAATLADLSQALLDCGVLPYYLHQLDRVQGTAHFEVEEERGREIVEALRIRLPGYAVPRYVREEAGAPSKTPL